MHDTDPAALLDLVVEMKFGSHLYGTATELSDLDIKGVYLPAAEDIILQRVRPTISLSRPKAPRERNAPGDVDREYLSLQRYLSLLADGQTMAIDMLFAPDLVMLRPPSPWWREIQRQAPHFISRQASAFVRYCRQQADKYGIKGSRVATARAALELLRAAEAAHDGSAKLGEIGPEVERFAATTEHSGTMDARGPGGIVIRHLEVCGRKMPYTASIKNAREIAERLVNEYGQRALQAERHEGVDWKALSHAVRVGREAIELFATGRITFPLPYAAHLIRIKQGEITYDAVADEIEQLVAEVDRAAAAAKLPDAPDRQAMDDIMRRAYGAKVAQAR
jgi:predicted nucleotidyltransferase